jgi:uncharacterized protein
MASEPIFVDTWGWLAYGHRRDAHHEVVRHLFEGFHRDPVPVYTTDHVLDEVITLLFRREQFDEAVRFVEAVFAAAAQGQVRIERVSSDRFTSAWSLRKRLQDKPGISFTDLLSMVVMREHGITRILTEDKHFLQVGLGFISVP